MRKNVSFLLEFTVYLLLYHLNGEATERRPIWDQIWTLNLFSPFRCTGGKSSEMCQENRICTIFLTHTKKNFMLIFKSTEIFFFTSLSCTARLRRASGSCAPQRSIKHVKVRNQARTQGTVMFLHSENWKGWH